MKCLLFILAVFLTGCVSQECKDISTMIVKDSRCSSGYTMLYSSGSASCMSEIQIKELKKHCSNF